MSLTARIAWRYLWKKKSHGAVSAIAAVAVTGVAVATAAIICVLSVFNGFRDLLVSTSDRIMPDIVVAPHEGKVIDDADMLADELSELRGVDVAMPVVEDQALVIFGRREMPVMLRGVDPEAFRRITSIDSLIIAGEPLAADLDASGLPGCLMSVGVGSRLQAYNPGEDPLFLFAPRREGRINPNNPATSFFTDSVAVVGVFQSGQGEVDESTLYVPIDVARGLFQYDVEATGIHIKAAAGEDIGEVAERVARKLNGVATLGRPDGFDADYVVRDRARLQETNFRMVEIEKWVTALLLFFILVIASFNIISTLTMFVLEKRRSMGALRSMGMTAGRIGGIFAWESMYVTLLGGLGGVLLGVGATLAQQHFGLITMDNGALTPIPYPVRFRPDDLWVVVAAILAIGGITALTAWSFARSRISEKRR